MMVKIEDIQQYGKEHLETVVSSATSLQNGFQAIASAYGDYTKAKIYHWLHNTDFQSPVGILESFKEPLESRVWYDYTDQSSPNGPIQVGSTNKPAHVGRVLDALKQSGL